MRGVFLILLALLATLLFTEPGGWSRVPKLQDTSLSPAPFSLWLGKGLGPGMFRGLVEVEIERALDSLDGF